MLGGTARRLISLSCGDYGRPAHCACIEKTVVRSRKINVSPWESGEGTVAERRKKVAHGETVGDRTKTNPAPDEAKEICARLFSVAPAGALATIPTVPSWATFCRAAGAFFCQAEPLTKAGAILFSARRKRVQKRWGSSQKNCRLTGNQIVA
jgi:hypothetical protein